MATQKPAEKDFSKYGTPVSEVGTQKKKSVFGTIARSIAEPIVELGVRPIQAVHSAISTAIDPLKEPDLAYDLPLYGKVSVPKEGKDILRDVGRGAELISYGLGGAAVKAGAQGVAKQSALQLAKRGAIEGAKVGGLAGAGQQVAETGELGAGTLKAGLTGAAVGGAIGGAVPLAVKGAKKVVQKGQGIMAEKTAQKAQEAALLRSKTPDASIATKTLQKGKVITDKTAKEVVRQGVPEADVALIKTSSSTDKSKMLKALDIREKQLTNRRVTERASDVVGDSVLSQAKYIEKTNRQAAKNLNTVAQRLSGKRVNAETAITQFSDDLERSGVGVRANGTLNFKNSDFEGIKSAQTAINNVWNRAVRVARKGDALELHRTKTYIDEIVSYGKQAEGLSGKAENILKSFRRNADGILDTRFPTYNNANTIYSETIQELNKLGEVMGRKFRLSDQFADTRTGVAMRRLFSNTQSRSTLLQLVESMQNVAKKYGMKIDEDVINQAAFVDMLEKSLGPEASTGLAGEVVKGLESFGSSGGFGGAQQLGSAASEAMRGNIVRGTIKAGGVLIDKLRGINQENRIKAIRALLKEGAKTSNFGTGGGLGSAVAKSVAKAERSAYTGGMETAIEKPTVQQLRNAAANLGKSPTVPNMRSAASNLGRKTALPVPKVVREAANPKTADPLLSEARKYKSVEDFMDSLNINYEDSGWRGPKDQNADNLRSLFSGKVFHGTNASDNILASGYKKDKYFNSGAYFSDTPDRAIEYMKQNRGTGKGSDVLINDLKNLKIKQGEGEIVRSISKANTGMEEYVASLKKQGYDGVKDAYGETLVWNTNKIKTPERLTDIWRRSQSKTVFGRK